MLTKPTFFNLTLILLFLYTYNLTAQTTPCTVGKLKYSPNYISNIKIGAINNTTSQGENGYLNSNMSTNLTSGINHIGSFTIQAVNWRAVNINYKIWLDYNNNGTFEEPNELIDSGSTQTEGVFSFNLLIPNKTISGPKTLRIAIASNSETITNGGCENHENIEADIEDYIINIIDSTKKNQNVAVLK